MFLISEALAQDAAAVPVPPTDNLAGINIVLIVGLFILFYFLMIRPQSKRLKEQKNMLEALKKGDEVVTNTGLIGKIAKISEDEQDVELEISKGVNIKVLKYTIQVNRSQSEANDNKKSDEKATEKKPAAAKKAPAKKPAAKKTTAKKPAASKTTKKA